MFIYSLEEKKSRQVTDGRSDAISPRFDKDGTKLYFIASTSAGLAQGWLDMTSMARPVTSSVYAAVLRKDLPSPVAPESDEAAETDAKKTTQDAKDEKKDAKDDKKAEAKDAKKDDKKEEKKPPEPVRIDFDGLDQRIVAMPIDRANYIALEAGAEGALFLVANPVVLSDEDYTDLEEAPAAGCLPLRREDAKDREADRESGRRHGRLRWMPDVRPVGGRNEDALRAEEEVVRGGVGQAAQARRRRACRVTSPSTSIRAPSGGRCTRRSGASSATSSTRPTSTGSISPRPNAPTKHSCQASAAAKTSTISSGR